MKGVGRLQPCMLVGGGGPSPQLKRFDRCAMAASRSTSSQSLACPLAPCFAVLLPVLRPARLRLLHCASRCSRLRGGRGQESRDASGVGVWAARRARGVRPPPPWGRCARLVRPWAAVDACLLWPYRSREGVPLVSGRRAAGSKDGRRGHQAGMGRRGARGQHGRGAVRRDLKRQIPQKI